MNVLAIIQARMGSSRLSGKVLMPIHGKPVLEHIINFLKFSKLTDRIIVATTDLPEDDPIVELAKKLDVDCFRGSSNDVLKRFYDAAKFFNGDIIVRITADDPLVDAELVDQVIHIIKETGCDFVSNVLHQTYPYGIFIEAVKFSTLEKMYKTLKDPLSKEHVTIHIKQNPNLYDVREVLTPKDMTRPEWRLSIDHKEDLDLMTEIFSRLYNPDSFIKYSSIVELLDKNKELLKINEKYNKKLND